MPSICIFVCMKMFLTAVIKDEHTSHDYSSLEIEKKYNAKYPQIDFLRFIFKPEVPSSSAMFVITKWTNQVLFCLSYLVQIK